MNDVTAKPLPLMPLHEALNARFAPFAGYAMPVQFDGVMAEHAWTRRSASLFDVSHMGQISVTGRDPAAALERLVPADLVGLAEGRQRYAVLTTEAGGIADDLMIANRGDDLLLVVNGATKAADLARLCDGLPDCAVTMHDGHALLALQGPEAGAILDAILPGAEAMRFMDARGFSHRGADVWVSRSGYTGEDGFEIALPTEAADPFARALLAHDAVRPAGLGARDSLRLEAGMPLYGQDLTPETSPVEAALGWSIPKVRRRDGARAGGFPGAERVLRELAVGAERRRVGLRPEGRAPMRHGTMLYHDEASVDPIGTVTSGGYGPTVGAPVSMAYLPAAVAAGTRIYGSVRGKRLPAIVADLPFHQPRYRR